MQIKKERNMNIKELDLLEKQEMRNKVVNRTEVLDKVKDLLTLPGTEYATTEQVAIYYEVNITAINSLVNDNRDELESDGLKLVKKLDIERNVLKEQNVGYVKYKTHIELLDNKGNNIKIANRGARLFPKRAILRVGMLLRDSKIAKEVRTRLLDIVHDVEQENPEIIKNIANEITEEKQLMLDRVEAEMNGDYSKVCEINAKLFALKNKRIEEQAETIKELETENKNITSNSLTIIESRAVINRIVRKIAMQEYSGMFGKAWGDLYGKLNYKLGINVKARKKEQNESYINTLTESEIFEVEKIVRNWAVEVGLDLDRLLKIA